MNILSNYTNKAFLFITIIFLTLSLNSYGQTYLPLTGGTLTGNLIMSSGTQIQTTYLMFPNAFTQPATSANVSIFANNTSQTVDILGWNGWRFIPPNSSAYSAPVFSIDNYGSVTMTGGLFISGTGNGSSFGFGSQIFGNNHSTLEVTQIDALELAIGTFPGSYTTDKVRVLDLELGIQKGSGHNINNAAGIVMSQTHSGTNNCDLCLFANYTDTQPAGNYAMYNNSAYGNYFRGVIGLASTSPTHTLTLGNTSTGVAAYNTADQTTNFERVREYWNGNVYNFLSEAGGTGVARNFSFSGGNVGIGTTAPQSSLHVSGAFLVGGASNRGNLDPAMPVDIAKSLPYTGQMLIGWNRAAGAGETDFIANQGAGGTGGFAFYNHDNSNNETQLMWILGDGQVLIGNTQGKQGNYLLAVAGSAVATSFTVKTVLSWPDYIFKKDYTLPSLSEVKTYIDKNQHLPEMPTAEQIEKDGLNLGEMNKLLVKKVEELTLYLIELNKQVKEQQKEIEKLKTK